jgi:colanic acid biosynthesis glycosyl transferase WcaI
MRVLILAQYFPPDMGGGATRAYNAARGLLKAGCRVTVISAFPHYPTGNILGEYRRKPLSVGFEGKLKIIRTFVPPLASEGFAKRILLFVSFVVSSLFALPFAGTADVVWGANPNIIAFFPSLIYKLVNRCKIVLNVDDLWPEALYDLGVKQNSFLVMFGELIAKIVYMLSSSITPISPAYMDILSHKYGVDRKKIFVVPAGVDADKFYYARKHVERERFRVLYIGAFSPAYDFDQVLRAAKSLLNESVDFVIHGGGELAHELKRKVKKASLRNVFVVDKIVSRNKVAGVMAEADILLLPLSGVGSIEFGISSKLYEYQASGKPILCCSNGQPARYVMETNSGIVVKPRDSDALAKAVIYLRENMCVAEKLGKDGRLYVRNHLSIETIGLQLKEIFEKLINNPLSD